MEENQGIMGLAPQVAPQPAPPPQQPAMSADPQAEAALAQARQEVPAGEFSQELLGAGEQMDPAAIAEFKQAISQLSLPAELLQMLQDLIMQILQDPSRYEEIRQQLISQGFPADFLPEQFDPEFMGALQVALTQVKPLQVPMAGPMEPANPTPPEGFANGGIATLNPVAQALQSYGRNGDTMLAHITPMEARALQMMGGSGTINPVTGLREYNWVSDAWKGIKNAVSKFAKSTVGKIITTVALGYFLGPAAASALGVTSAAGVAAVSGFIGGFGSSLAAGEGFKSALKSGAVNGLVAGAGSAVMGGSQALQAGSYAGPTTISGQYEKFTDLFSPSAQATVPAGTPATPGQAVSQAGAPAQVPPPTPASPMAQAAPTPAAPPAAPGAPVAPGGIQTLGQTLPAELGDVMAMPGGGIREVGATLNPLASAPAAAPQSFLQRNVLGPAENFYKEYLSPSEIAARGEQTALQKYQTVMQQTGNEKLAMSAYEKALPGAFSKYGPLTLAGIGTLAATGAFSPEPIPESELAKRLKMGPYEYFMQNKDKFGVNLGGVTTTYAQPPVRAARGGIATMAPRRFNMGGFANGGTPEYPRRTGPINGPGTGTSDSIPAMLSDGEFVMTARAVRGAGNGSRREGARRMYQMMKQFEGNA